MRWLSSYHLSVTERKGFIVILAILFLLITVRVVLAFWPVQMPENQSTLKQEMKEWRLEQRQALLVSESFDPNLVADSIILQFKLPAYAISNWIKFRNQGRRFDKPENMLLIYGMDTLWFEVNRDSIFISEINPAESPKKKAYFDPNTASREVFLQVGMPGYLADRIIKYRNAGGKFSSPDDLKKIYGFPESLYLELKPYVRINKVDEVHQTASIPESEVNESINLNQCDSLQLLELPGIGPTFAGRILKYRKQLGGFYTAVQLLEVYGFTLDKLERISNRLEVNGVEVKKMSINTATFKQLLAHPYLNYEQVKQIVNYREKIGRFKNLDGLGQLEHFSAKDVERLRPYLSVE